MLVLKGIIMDAPTTTTLHCMRGHAPTAQCLCKLQKLSVILEASKLDAFEYSSATDTLTVYDNCLNVLERVEDFLQNIDYDSSIDAEYRPSVKQFMSGDVSKPVHSSGIRFQTGTHVHCLLQGMLLPDNDDSYTILGTIKDITSFSEKEQQLEIKAQIDSLTGLFNHAHGMELTTKALLTKNPFDTCAFVLVDLDFFKQINDTYGHLFGDHVLCETANIFKAVLPSDTIISRYGGDEFILFFPNISKIDLIQRLNRLMQHIRDVEMLNDTDNLTCSMGICFVPENTTGYTYDQLMENADWALYQAKDNGRDTYIFCDDMNRYQELRNADSNSRNKIDARYFQNDPIATAFEVMETSLSVEEGISMLLKIIGMRFHLDRISIIDMNLNELTAEHAYCWTKDASVFCFKDEFSFSKEEFHHIFQLRDDTGLIELSADGVDAKMPLTYKAISSTNTKTLLLSPMFWQGQMVGIMTFSVCNKTRHWSRHSKQQINELTKIIAGHHQQHKVMNAPQRNLLADNKIDRLTGLISFTQFCERIEEIIFSGQAKNHAIIYTDFERFNLINQKYGYGFGDKLLQLFTGFVTSALNDKKNILFTRVVADQFILFRPYENIADAEVKVHAINNNFMEHVTKLYPYLKLRLRSGIYHVTGKCKTATEAIDAANFARKSLLNQPLSTAALYNEEMAAKQQLERIIFANANTAFSEKNFKVFLQPKFSLEDNSLIGAEALVRWFRDDGTQIYPDQFIPALEDNGRITELDFFVFECVAKFLAKNKSLGRQQVPISINASVLHTQNDDTVQRYLEILERYQIEPSLVEIELTETAAAENYDKVYQLFDELRQTGIKTSLDDFGAGYSLVNMVVDIPIDTVKIDRQLLLSCENSVKGRIFLKNSIAMLHSLGYSIICEGVETDEQRHLLLDCGCYKGQGYLFSRPVPISEYEARFYNTKA